MSVPPPDSRRSEWMTDLEELADLAAETVAPAEVPAARRRRRGYSAAGLVALLSAGAAAPEPAGAATPPQAPAPAPAPAPAWAGRRLPRRRRLLGTTLAVVGASALCAAVLLHLPTPDPAPLTGGPVYTTPSPDTGAGVAALQPVQLDPAPPAPLATSAPLSSPAPRAATVRPAGQGGTAPAPTPTVRLAPVVIAPGTAAPAPPPTASAPPTAPPATAPPSTPTAAPSATPAASPSPSPAGPLTVRGVTLSMGTCEDRGGFWVCPETATFTFNPGAQGTLTFSIAGIDTTCSGTSSAFDQGQPSVNIPQGTVRAVVTSALVFPAASHPGAMGPGRAPSTAAVRITSPNRLSSASEPFGGASCP